MEDSVAPKSRFLPQGLQNLKEPDRLDAARKSFLAADVKMKDSYMVTSRYDMIAICEAPGGGIPGPSTPVGNVEREQHIGDLSCFHGSIAEGRSGSLTG